MRDQRPPIGERQRIVVSRSRGVGDDEETATILYRRKADCWEVSTPAVDEWKPFASGDARDRDVRQLINKKWCYRYGDPDPLDDFS